MSDTTPGQRPQAKDISDVATLAAVLAEQNHRSASLSIQTTVPAGRWAVAERLDAPEKVVLAKLRKLVKRGLLDGCVCGCRGDFQLTLAGGELLGALE